MHGTWASKSHNFSFIIFTAYIKNMNFDQPKCSEHLRATLCLYDMIGGERALESIIDVAFARMVDDSNLSYFLGGINFESAKDYLIEFFTIILKHGLPSDTTNMDMEVFQHLEGIFTLGFAESHFDLMIGHLVLTLEHFAVTRLTIVEIVRNISPLRRLITLGVHEVSQRQARARRALSS